MVERHPHFPQPPVASSHSPRWPVYLYVIFLSVVSSLISFTGAILSINEVVILISIGTSIGCLFLALLLASRRRTGYAFFLVIANVPIAFVLAILYFYVQSIEKEMMAKMPKIEKPFGPLVALDQAVRVGILRKATLEDVKAWRNAYFEKKYTSNNLTVPDNDDALGASKIELSRAYVVLKKFTFPPGLTGEVRTVFFIPKGSPKPSGEYGHSVIYDLETLTIELHPL